MHDLHEANKIFNLILEYAKKNNLKKVTKACIELGVIIEHGEPLSAENLEFNIKSLAKRSIAEGLEVDIKKVKADYWKLKEIEGE